MARSRSMEVRQQLVQFEYPQEDMFRTGLCENVLHHVRICVSSSEGGWLDNIAHERELGADVPRSVHLSTQPKTSTYDGQKLFQRALTSTPMVTKDSQKPTTCGSGGQQCAGLSIRRTVFQMYCTTRSIFLVVGDWLVGQSVFWGIPFSRSDGWSWHGKGVCLCKSLVEPEVLENVESWARIVTIIADASD